MSQPAVTPQRAARRPRVLVAIDVLLAQEVVDSLSSLLACMNAQVDLLHVWQPPAALSALEERIQKLDAESRCRELREIMRNESQVWLGDLEHRLLEAGLEVCTLVDVGSPSACIIEHARIGDHALIVLAKRSRSVLERALRGSVSELVLRESPVPVMMVPVEGEDESSGQAA